MAPMFVLKAWVTSYLVIVSFCSAASFRERPPRSSSILISEISSTPPLSFYQKIVMATISGLSGMVVVYPIDIIKTQLQSSRVRNIGLIGSIISTTGSIISSSGVFGLWRGFPAAALGIAPEKGITFAVNDGIRDYYMANHPHQKLSLQEEIIAGTAAGVAQLVMYVR
mmetsp:Transcript_29624/g.30020  ORF Transcript_29624/g.30020 Transcript_29624/m.30020 type:complete len:168 (-) Transcript_29624:497-1000(-)